MPVLATVEPSQEDGEESGLQRIPPLGSLEAIGEKYVPLDHACDGYDEEWDNCRGLPDCGPCKPVDAMWGSWTEWYHGGGCIGLQFRSRSIKVRANHCGRPLTGAKVESQRFILDKCKMHGTPCVFSGWSEWTQCKDERDQSMRTRKVDRPPSKGGDSCKGALQETRPCGGPRKHDCVFTQWQAWTSCSSTCGEGRHTRMRRIETDAIHEGKSCEDMVLQTTSCKAQECLGQDCQLSQWDEWSQCDQDHSQRYRKRRIMQPPKGSGQPCGKNLEETCGCPKAKPTDCIVGHWSEWSRCDASCDGGQHYRERQISAPPSHGGQCPHVELRMAAPCGTQQCFPGVKRDCTLSTWGEWAACSTTCGPGSRSRMRRIDVFAALGGHGCEGPLEELESCHKDECRRSDCQWSMWEDWSSCSCTCGGGTQHRTRQILVAPTNGGQSCEAEDKAEVGPCNEQPCGQGCRDGRWGSWQSWTECSGSCSTTYRSRRRFVEEHANHCGKAPVGLREQYERCSHLPSCTVDRDCKASEWSEWSHCSCHCFGVRERNRYILEFSAGQGRQCTEALKVIEACNPAPGEQSPADCTDKPQRDCVMDDWATWSRCSVTCGGGQMARRRSMLTPAENGGRPCESDLVVTSACSTQPCQATKCEDCLWGEWSHWGDCSRCGGQKYRHRSILRMPNHCGRRCEQKDAKEVSECVSDCEETRFCTWSEWSDRQCGGCGRATSMRHRALRLVDKAEHYLFVGTSESKCAGSQLNQSACPYERPCSSCVPVPCEFGTWSEWGAPSCQGLCERQRVIGQMNNECGKPCQGPLHETKRCPSSCEETKDCAISEWSEWSECQQGAVNAQRFRKREITQRPAHGGQPCLGVLSETAGCNVEAPKSCHFDPWHTWSACSASCGFGWHTRLRRIVEPARNGGFPCMGPVKELQHCMSWDDGICAQPKNANCVMGEWGEWTACGLDGQRYRDRNVLQMAAPGGKACEGCLHETETCALTTVDCRASGWTEWDACDVTCGKGQAHRQRQIHRFPENGGRPCPHELMETKGCNMQVCVVKDCKVSGWSEWGHCSEPCGVGMQTRAKNVLFLRDPGGRGYTGVLGEARPCEHNPECGKTDCEWNDWKDWSDCTHTCGGGQKKRNRHILKYPRNGGRGCDEEVTEQVDACNTAPCGSGPCTDSKFGHWSAWASCSVSCDGGTTFRTRKITQMANECGCPAPGKDREVAFCNLEVPCTPTVDCKLTPWNDWTECSASCNGVKHRSRHVGTYGRGNGEMCKGALKQTWPCNSNENTQGCGTGPRRDCVLTDWREWTICTATCGGGEHMRSRSIRTHPANGGKGCDDAMVELRECARGDCAGPPPADCKFGEWEEWAECDRCSGERKRLRKILTFPRNGGQECEPTSSEEIGKCTRKCTQEKFCIWQDWGAWTRCTATCGKGGKRRRRRTLVLSEHGHTLRPDETGHVEMKYAGLKRRAKELEANHVHEAAVSFLAGCLALVAGLAAVRFCTSRRSAAAQGYNGLEVRGPRLARASDSRNRRGHDAEGGTYHHLRELNETEVSQAMLGLEIE